jgi:hypothetical protein
MSDVPDQPLSNVPPIPRRGPPPLPEKPSRSVWSIIVAGVTSVVLFIGLMFLAGPWSGIIACIVLVVGLFCTLAFGHYLIWGQWLGDAIRQEVAEEERKDAEDALRKF